MAVHVTTNQRPSFVCDLKYLVPRMFKFSFQKRKNPTVELLSRSPVCDVTVRELWTFVRYIQRYEVMVACLDIIRKLL